MLKGFVSFIFRNSVTWAVVCLILLVLPSVSMGILNLYHIRSINASHPHRRLRLQLIHHHLNNKNMQRVNFMTSNSASAFEDLVAVLATSWRWILCHTSRQACAVSCGMNNACLLSAAWVEFCTNTNNFLGISLLTASLRGRNLYDTSIHGLRWTQTQPISEYCHFSGASPPWIMLQLQHHGPYHFLWNGVYCRSLGRCKCRQYLPRCRHELWVWTWYGT